MSEIKGTKPPPIMAQSDSCRQGWVCSDNHHAQAQEKESPRLHPDGRCDGGGSHTAHLCKPAWATNPEEL